MFSVSPTGSDRAGRRGMGEMLGGAPGRSDVGLLGMQGSCGLMKSEPFLLSPLTTLPESRRKLLDAHRPLL